MRIFKESIPTSDKNSGKIPLFSLLYILLGKHSWKGFYSDFLYNVFFPPEVFSSLFSGRTNCVFHFLQVFLIFVPDLKIASFTRKALILKPFSTFCACLSSQCFSFPADCLQNHRWDSFIRWILFSQLTCYKMKLDLDK